jgi:hypothetical protein
VSPFLPTRALPEDATEAALRADVLQGLTDCHVAILHRVAFRNASRPGW